MAIEKNQRIKAAKSECKTSKKKPPSKRSRTLDKEISLKHKARKVTKVSNTNPKREFTLSKNRK